MSTVDFRKLPFEDQKRHFVTVARRALPLWGYPATSELTLLNITENATYRVSHPDHPNIVMRVHRLDYAARDSIRTEVDWLQFLHENTDLKVVEPLPAQDGSFVQTIETVEMNEQRNVVCFAFAAGKPPRDSQDDNDEFGKIAGVLQRIPKFVTLPLFKFAAVLYEALGGRSHPKDKLTPEDRALYRKLGSIAATLHTASQQWTPPEYYQRIEWDWDATFGGGWNNYYGRHYRELKGLLGERDLRSIDDCAALIQRRLEAYGQASDRYGMIHSDLRMANLLIDGEDITALDFDDCGRGWYLYDVACILGFQEHRPDLQLVFDAIFEGYESVSPLEEADKLEVWSFVMMRRIGLLQALIYHLNNISAGSGESAELTPEIMAFYAKGTAVLARHYTKTYASLPLPAPRTSAFSSSVILAPVAEAVGV